MNDGKHAGDGGPAEYAEGRVTEPLDPPSQRQPVEGGAPDIAEDNLKGFRFDATGMPMGPSDMPVPDVPSPLAARYLFPTEKYRGEWRRHWIHLMPVIVVGVLATFVAGYTTGVFGQSANSGALVTGVIVVYLCILMWGAWRVFDWYFDRFILTNKRVMVISGIVTRKVAMMPLLRVTDMKYEQSPLGRMMNYGSFVMESAGQDQALREVKHLPDPNELYLQICEEMYEPEAVDARDTVDESLDEAQAVDNKLGGDA